HSSEKAHTHQSNGHLLRPVREASFIREAGRGGYARIPGMTPDRAPRVPEKPTIDGLEERWAAVWDEQGTYRFDRSRSRSEIYSIDTPPPTVSGSLHVGHVFSFTHTDL